MSAAADFDRTRTVQWEASDPAASAWVVANAGSGKTHVLTQRVLRLLLAGADPAAILCLTFTKVAAAEMSRRIFETLGRWTTLPEAELRTALTDLQGSPPPALLLRAARRLFARALETPGGLKIQTIHAFCEKLLHQFPFEANVPGQFAILDDTAASTMIASARGEVMAEVAAEPDSRLGRAMRYLAEHATDAQIGAALDCVVAEREAIRRWIVNAAPDGQAGSVDDALADLRTRLVLAPEDTEASICGEICQAANWGRRDCEAFAERLVEALATAPHTTNARTAARLRTLLAAGEDRAEAQARIELFLHGETDGQWRVFAASHRFRSHRFGAEFGKSNPELLDRFENESARLLTLTERLRSARNFAATEALLVVGDAILNAYHQAKRQGGYLDFGDLIVKARNLLSRADAAAWVLYKLDARIDHILVDEAQDTSPDQWAVVRALAADFFAGKGACGPRTVFAVGDDKQSIFGFQGAAPHMLAEMERFFHRAAEDGQAPFVRRPLTLSFRSTTEVLDAVDRVITGDLREKVTASGYEGHTARRFQTPGQVIVMPRFVRRRGAQPEDWTLPLDAPAAAETALAEQIAGEIESLIGSHLPSGRKVVPGGILVLTRKRGAFVTAMNRALRAHAIAAAGADRIPVASHIAVLDLLALADVMLLPEDDLQLAACLKSPLIGLDEDALMRIAADRGAMSLWSALGTSPDASPIQAASRLNAWRGMADQVTPFRFFATVLGPDGGRRAFRERLGGEADDVLDAFLTQALNYERSEPPSLHGFLRAIRASRGDIKREAEEASAGVRVMTVHGAKGLEADVVFLADTGSRIVHSAHRSVLVDVGGGSDEPAFLWRRSGNEATDLQRQADLAADEETRNEYLRLLYVGMTRARDALYLCGIRGERGEEEGCWYSLAARALLPETVERDPETGELLGPYRWPQPPRPAGPPVAEATARPGEIRTPPDWLYRPALAPPSAPRPLRPSRALGEPDPLGAAAGGLAADRASPAGSGLRRGQLVHSLLHMLPRLDEVERREVARRFLLRELPDAAALAEGVLAEAERVLASPALAGIFGPGSRAEVPIVGRVFTGSGEFAVSGQIDRLAREGSGWHVVDFKTNREIPPSAEAIDPAHILQLALYRRLLEEAQPGYSVRASLVWTAEANVMPVPADLMEQALANLGIRAMSFP